MNPKFHEYVTSSTFNLSLSGPQIRYLSAHWAQEIDQARWLAISKAHGHGHKELDRCSLTILLERFRAHNWIATGGALVEKGLLEDVYRKELGPKGFEVTKHSYRLTTAGKLVCALLKQSGQLIKLAEPGDVIEKRRA